MSFCGVDGWGPFSKQRIDFTQCFEETILYIVPEICIMIFVATRYLQLATKSPIAHQLAITFILKLIGVSLFVIVSIADFLMISLATWQPLRFLLIFSSFLTIITACFVAAGTYYLQWREEFGSSGLQLFWLVFAMVNAIKIRTLVMVGDSYAIPVIYLILSIFLFALEMLRKPTAQYIPLDNEEIECPEDKANILSRLTFWWVNPLVLQGYRNPLSMKDLSEVPKEDLVPKISEKFNNEWVKYEKSTSALSLVNTLTKAYGGPFFLAGVIKFVHDFVAYIQPNLLGSLIIFISSQSTADPQPVEIGYCIALGMLVTSLIQTLFIHQYFHLTFLTGMRLRAGVVAAIYQKSLKMTGEAKGRFTVGELVNHMSVDAQRLMDLCTYLHTIWSGPLQIGLGLYFLYQTLGISVIAGLAIMILMIPLNAYIAKLSRSLQQKQMKTKDSRIKLTDEILNGIKIIKLYSWEQSFYEKITGIRAQELENFRRMGWLRGLGVFFWGASPFLVGLASFSMYVAVSDEPLTAEKAFVSLSLFNLLQFPLTMFPTVITSTVEASVAMSRIRTFLQCDELDEKNTEKGFDDPSQKNAIVVHNGEFQWAKSAYQASLRAINMEVARGSFVAVVGSVGSGKSSLISAILGDMQKNHGEVIINGSVSFVPQQAWILNATVRENILFGKEYDERRYNEVLDACALRPDLEVLIAGDMTEIGEKGINLSGGQKQRISIARAVYSDCDIIILDDPLSAVDSHVAKHLFDRVLGSKGLLRRKTRLLVTNAVQFLPRSDWIVVMKDGTIEEQGTYEDLKASEEGSFRKVLTEYSKIDNDTPQSERAGLTGSTQSLRGSSSTTSTGIPLSLEEQEEIQKKKLKEEKEKSERGKQIGIEAHHAGSVEWSVYATYFASVGFASVLLLLVLYISTQVLQIGSSFWLSYWSEQNSAPTPDRSVLFYLGIYALFGLLQIVVIFVRSCFLYVYCAVRSASFIHETLLFRIFHAPMAFFDTTPIGRILNRFSKDMYTIDEVLPGSFASFLATMMTVIGVISVICISTPFFLGVIIPLGIVYYLIQRFYIPTSRELRRLESITRSPIYSHFSETLAGVNSVRAFRQQLRFVEQNENLLAINQRSYFATIASNRWLASRLEVIGALIVFMSSLLAVLSYQSIDSGVAGMSVAYALSVTQALNWMVRQSTEIESNIVSVERLKEYTEIELEAPHHIEGNKPPASWPESGEITFSDYSCRYRRELDLVIRNISITIKPREKIGIVGRTGAGKSSITLALFRIVEAAEGRILIDGIDISTIGLADLRSKITIIPQDPVLFSGTIRENLDPFNTHSDEELWAALRSSHLYNFVSTLNDKLDSIVNQGGENFSVGQRQLICLGRALLRKTSILVLDEATAAIDVETDSLIQETIRKEFASCTVLTIAHRLNTIIDNDRILVLDKGKVKEFDSPQVLLEDDETIFYSMAKKANLI